MNDYRDFYNSVYRNDHPDDLPHGWIQWKGTNVCIDLHCVCGFHGHIDGWFAYYYRCVNCGKKYALGQVVKLIPLTEEQAAVVEKNLDPYKEDGSWGQ